MKKIFIPLVILFITLIGFSQEKPSGWKELDDFHAIVAPVFHTFEKGNFHAAKDSAGLVLDRARSWQASNIPPGLDASIYKPLIDKLVAQCLLVYDAVQTKKTDEELKPLLRKAHNTFHEILAKYNQSDNKPKS